MVVPTGEDEMVVYKDGKPVMPYTTFVCPHDGCEHLEFVTFTESIEHQTTVHEL